MRPTARSADGKLSALADAHRVQTCDKIARQKGAIAWRADDPGNVGPVRRGPVERREDSRQGTKKSWSRVGDDGQIERLKTRRIAIGVDDERIALRREPRGDPFEQCAPAERPQRFVAAANPAGEAARENDANRRCKIAGHRRNVG